MPVELAELLRRCREGDELAWEGLVRAYQARVYAIAYGYTGNAEEARDLAQEVFVRVYRHIDRCPEPEKFLAWLVRIARNAGVDHLRRRKARPPAQDIPVEEAHHLAAPGARPDEEAAAVDRRELVYRALQELSVKNREIILLKDMQGLPLEEISQMLGIPLGTVKSRSNRARLELAQAVLALEAGRGAVGA
jgi:RNA polymerase sigma-70 factor (ECF subfamily)